jgi:O-antigen/teichoic acid export membrane protein
VLKLSKQFSNFSRGPNTLKSRALQAASITVIGHFLSLSLRLFSSVILTRLLSPDLFGVLAVVTAIQIVIALLTDVGLRQAVVQSRRGSDRVFQDTAWTLQVLRGFIIWGVGLAIGAALYSVQIFELLPQGSAYSDAQLPRLVAVSSISGAILGLQSIHYILASRDLNLGRITMIDLVSQIGSLVVVVVIAWVTHSIWSYVLGGLFGALLLVVLSYFCLRGHISRLSFDRDAMAELSQFGKWVFLSSAVGALGLNGDRLLLAALVSPSVLGNFSIATNLAAVPEGVVNRVMGNISLPALSEVWRETPDRLAEVYWRMRCILDLAVISMAGLLFATGKWIIFLLYDSRYSAAGPMIQLLSFSLLLTRYSLAPNLYLALGFPHYVTLLTAVKMISLVTIVPLLYVLFDVPGAVIGISVHMLPFALCTFLINRRFRLNRFDLEIALLGAWPIGWVVGRGALMIVGHQAGF